MPGKSDLTKVLLTKEVLQQIPAIAKNLASLNEIVAEFAQALVDLGQSDTEFCELVRGTLQDHSWALGFEFQGERPPGGHRAYCEDGCDFEIVRPGAASLGAGPSTTAPDKPHGPAGQ